MSTSSNISTYVERLSDALAAAIANGRVGAPRFVRWIDRIPVSESPTDAITSGIEVCNRVFGSTPVREYIHGDDALQGTLHAVWDNGASAIISAGPAGSGVNTGPEIMLLGSSGAVYFDGAQGGVATVELVGRG
ncbi:MAG TPA: hypothetical protein QF694_04840 [Dehalococcoidia bacterium]|nr:hypothetical protein [Dehalococcoidia bacterium]